MVDPTMQDSPKGDVALSEFSDKFECPQSHNTSRTRSPTKSAREARPRKFRLLGITPIVDWTFDGTAAMSGARLSRG